jgi:hypothetical protein
VFRAKEFFKNEEFLQRRNLLLTCFWEAESLFQLWIGCRYKSLQPIFIFNKTGHFTKFLI